MTAFYITMTKNCDSRGFSDNLFFTFRHHKQYKFKVQYNMVLIQTNCDFSMMFSNQCICNFIFHKSFLVCIPLRVNLYISFDLITYILYDSSLVFISFEFIFFLFHEIFLVLISFDVIFCIL